MEFIHIDMPFYMILDIKKKEKTTDFKFSDWVIEHYHKDFLDVELLTNHTKQSLVEAEAIIADSKKNKTRDKCFV